MTYTKEQAKAADARLAERYKALYKAKDTLDYAISGLAYTLNAKRVYPRGGQGFMSFGNGRRITVEDILSRVDAARNTDGWRIDRGDDKLEKLKEAQRKLFAAEKSVEESEQEWEDNGRWSRFFAVSGGHIHSSTRCSSLRETTRIGWLPELAAETEKEAVDAYGSVICTICFPSAPVEWTVGKVKTQAQVGKEAKAAERAAKQAEKDAKKIIDPTTGEPLRSSSGRELNTERAATNELSSVMDSFAWYGTDHPEAPNWLSYIDRATVALAAKKLTADGNSPSEEEVAAEAANIRSVYAKKKGWDEAKSTSPDPITERINAIALPPEMGTDDLLYRVGFKDGAPHTIEQFDWNDKKWGRSMIVGGGIGKALLGTIEQVPVNERVPSEKTAAAYGAATGKCLMCGKGLSGAASLARGYGPECAGKVR